MISLTPEQQQILLDWQAKQPITTTLKPGEPFPKDCQAAYDKAAALVRDVIEERRTGARSDFLSDLVKARDQGDKLSDVELFDQIFGIFAAIASTPRSGSGGLYELYTHRDQLDQLIADPSLIPEAIEECLRIAGNGYFTFPRIATCDTEVGGTPILKGMVVRPSPQAANLDPNVFPDPLRFDIHRKPRRIMTFGAGPHHCIGNALGRMTLTIAVRRLLARFPRARLADPGFRPSYGGAAGELRMKTLPMVTH
jgi:cytochrome P450